ncbi:hypothetical protein [Mesorhizobium sp.]|uniref:hypothetical protein n=1 Tax=Mesorhizobium sp. TaxID=1871066 RepID=UPI000FE9297C|nr:hypothetical protein [Mesorhizobium sp.]RWO81044.1 MAG: hypothetical protein EOQ96_25760 [Mesorhizobium sp.]
MIQDAVAELCGIGLKLTEALSIEQLEIVEQCIASLEQPLSHQDVEALVGLLPEEEDSAFGLNWTILHAIEGAPGWPRWDLLRNKESTWVRTFRQRLANGGFHPPSGSDSGSA